MKLRDFQEKIAALLENKHSLLENVIVEDGAKPTFEVDTDLSTLENLISFLPENFESRFTVFFAQLALHFEAAIHLRRLDGRWLVKSFFVDGLIYRYNSNKDCCIEIPEMGPLDVRKTKSKSILSDLDLEFLNPKDDLQMFLLKPIDSECLLLLTNLAEPWQPDYLAKIRDLAIRVCID